MVMTMIMKKWRMQDHKLLWSKSALMLPRCSLNTSISLTSSCSLFVCSLYLLHQQLVMPRWHSSPWKRCRTSSIVLDIWMHPALRLQPSSLVLTSALNHRMVAVRMLVFYYNPSIYSVFQQQHGINPFLPRE